MWDQTATLSLRRRRIASQEDLKYDPVVRQIEKLQIRLHLELYRPSRTAIAVKNAVRVAKMSIWYYICAAHVHQKQANMSTYLPRSSSHANGCSDQATKKSFGCHQSRHRAQGRTSTTTRLTSSTQEQPKQGASSQLKLDQAQASVTLER